MSDLRGVSISQDIRAGRCPGPHTVICSELGALMDLTTEMNRWVMESHGFYSEIRDALAYTLHNLGWAHAHAHEDCGNT